MLVVFSAGFGGRTEEGGEVRKGTFLIKKEISTLTSSLLLVYLHLIFHYLVSQDFYYLHNES